MFHLKRKTGPLLVLAIFASRYVSPYCESFQIGCSRKMAYSHYNLSIIGLARVAFFFFLPVASHATDYWISPAGNDGNTCASISSTEQDPPADPGTYKATVNGAIACLAAGDRVIVKAGTYTVSSGNIINNPPSGRSSSDRTVIMADPAGSRPVLQGPCGATMNGSVEEVCNYVRWMVLTGKSYIRVQGFEIRYFYEGIFCGKNCGASVNENYIDVLNNYFHHSYTKAIGVNHSPTDGHHLIRGNKFAFIGIGHPKYVPGTPIFYNVGNYTTIEQNVFHDSTHAIDICGGASCAGPYQTAAGVIVRNNVFYNMGRFDLNTWAVGANAASSILSNAPVDSVNGHQFYNNIICNSGNTSAFVGIAVQYGASTDNILIANNTVYNLISGSATAIFAASGKPSVQVRNNIAYLAGTGISADTKSNNMSSNPFFVNASAQDFRLQSGSAAIDAGATIQQVSLDYAGKPRPQGGAYDIGAYEGNSGDSVVPAAPRNLSVR